MIYILSLGVSTLIIPQIPQKLSVFSDFFAFFLRIYRVNADYQVVMAMRF